MDEDMDICCVVSSSSRSRKPSLTGVTCSFIETLSTVFAMDTTWSYFVVEFEDILTVAHIVW